MLPLLFACRWIVHYKLWQDPVLDNHNRAHKEIRDRANACGFDSTKMKNMVCISLLKIWILMFL